MKWWLHKLLPALHQWERREEVQRWPSTVSVVVGGMRFIGHARVFHLYVCDCGAEEIR